MKKSATKSMHKTALGKKHGSPMNRLSAELPKKKKTHADRKGTAKARAG
jgi:hypothetical protein